MGQIDLSCHSALGISVLDAAGTFLASSVKHADRYGLPVKDVVGRNWREWGSSSEIQRLEPLMARAVAGTPQVTPIIAIRSDKRFALSQATMLPVPGPGGAPGMLTLHRLVFIPPRTAGADIEGATLDVGALVSEMSRELARSARRGGLRELSRVLDTLASHAGGLLDQMARSTGLRPH